jgi:hypothetical protein
VRIAEVEPSGRIVLGCGGCGERIVLFGREEDWRGEGRLAFRCAGCGGEVGLDERAEEAKEEGDFVASLVRKVKRSDP